MRKQQELTDPRSYMSRARANEMTFVLLGRDAAAPFAIRKWVEERIRLGKNRRDDAQIVEALTAADTMERETETCTCAALRCVNGTIIKGDRHGDCFRAALEIDEDARNAEQGFLTTLGRFVDRREGQRIQKAAGIASADPEGYRGDELFSEDLY